MGISKVERLMNLVIALLATRNYLTAERIRNTVLGYSDCPTDEAFSRMFERDKNELRDLGIPLETGRVSKLDPAEGYRIKRDAYALPDIALTPDEAAAVAVAVQLWQSPELITATQGALLKLRAAGIDIEAVDSSSSPVSIASAVRAARHSRLRAGAANPVGRHRLWAGGAIPAPVLAGRAVQHPHRRAVGCGHRPRPLVSRRQGPRPRRGAHVPAVAYRCGGDADRARRRGAQARRRRPARHRREGGG